MANRYRKPPPDLVKASKELQRRVSLLETSPRAATTSVDTGHWQFKASNGVVMVDFGDQGVGLGRGFVFRRGEGGEAAFYLGGNQVSGRQFWRLCDNSQNDIITDDAQSGQGLARPYIPITATKFTEVGAGAQTTSLTSFAGAYQLYGYKQHPQLEIQYIVFTPAGISAEVQIFDGINNVPIAGPVAYGPNTFVVDTQRGPITGNHMSPLAHQLQYRVSGGAGTIGITLVNAYGVQS